MKSTVTVSHEKLFPSGDYLFTAVINGQIMRNRYSNYSLAEAKRQFAKLVKRDSRNLTLSPGS